MASPKISTTQQRKIEVIVTKWHGKLTWSALVQKIELDLGLKTTRQTLCTYAGIDLTYQNRKAELRGATPSLYAKITASDVDLIDRIETLEATIKILEKNNAEQLRMIERILTNANDIPSIDLQVLVQKRPEDNL